MALLPLTSLDNLIFRLAVAICAGCLLCTPAQSQTLNIRADEWFPMNGDPSSDSPGYMIELAQAIFEPKGIKVNYEVLPWDRAVSLTRKGAIHCVVGAYKEDTPDFLFPSEHWGVDTVHFYILAGDRWKYTGQRSSLKKRRIGLISAYSYGEEFDAFAKENTGLNFQYMTGNDALSKNIKKLLSLRINTIVESRFVMEAKRKALELEEQIVSAGQLAPGFPMYIACSPNHPDTQAYVTMVDKAMPQLRKSGTFSRILQKYGLEAW